MALRDSQVRVRYAPSPTGSPHVGNIRTALFDDLFARHHGGVNIVRIEDTDRSRLVPGCEEEILESLRWIGIQWQEGPDVGGPCAPYRQSERKEAGIYEPIIQKLIASGAAYWAFDTTEELDEMREFQRINKQPTGYFGGEWRDATDAQIEAARAKGLPGVLRLRVPRGETIVIDDAIRGRVEVDSNTVDDPVLIKNDGMPTYHFAAMVDDDLMGITHVFRGEEWISSAPKHLVLFRALGKTPPVLVHVPVIKGKDGSKLSKRHGDTACLDYRRGGTLPEALANFIALIGWSPGDDREIMTMEEMAAAFDIRGLQPSSGVFDLDKLVWMNGNYIRGLSPEALVDRVLAYAGSAERDDYWLRKDEAGTPTRPQGEAIVANLDLLRDSAGRDRAYVAQAITLEQERVTNLADFGPACAFFLQEEPPFDDASVQKWRGQEHIGPMFDHFIATLSAGAAADESGCEAMVRDYAAANGFEKLGPVVHPTRIALTGKSTGPGLFQLMAVLGPDRMVARLQRAKGVFA